MKCSILNAIVHVACILLCIALCLSLWWLAGYDFNTRGDQAVGAAITALLSGCGGAVIGAAVTSS